MDPNLFHIDWERTIEALVGIVILSFIIERVCAVLFESKWWINRFDDNRVGDLPEKPETKNEKTSKFPLKELIGFLVALAVCFKWDFDAVSIILLSDTTSLIGIIVTAAVISGGSKASVKLFHNILDVQSSAKRQRGRLRDRDERAAGLQ